MSPERTSSSMRPLLPAHTMGAVALGITLIVTSVMSLLFHGEITLPMIATGVTCVLVISPLSTSIVRKYARALRSANRLLESRVDERTADLHAAYTELERQTAERATLEHQLLLHDRMATAGTLAAGIAHEIKNPLTGITVNLAFMHQTLEDHTHGEALPLDLLMNFVQDAREAAHQVDTIARDLNHLAQPAEDHLEPTNSLDAVQTAVRLATHELRHRCTVKTDFAPVPPVLASHARLIPSAPTPSRCTHAPTPTAPPTAFASPSPTPASACPPTSSSTCLSPSSPPGAAGAEPAWGWRSAKTS